MRCARDENLKTYTRPRGDTGLVKGGGRGCAHVALRIIYRVYTPGARRRLQQQQCAENSLFREAYANARWANQLIFITGDILLDHPTGNRNRGEWF